MDTTKVSWPRAVVLVVAVLGVAAFGGLRLWAATGEAPAGLPDTLPTCDADNCVASAPTTRSDRLVEPLDCTFSEALDAVADLDRATPVATDEVDDVRFGHLTVRTRWLGFTDDVVLRGPPGGPVDVFSGSRLGQDDLGVNASRVEVVRGTCEG